MKTVTKFNRRQIILLVAIFATFLPIGIFVSYRSKYMYEEMQTWPTNSSALTISGKLGNITGFRYLINSKICEAADEDIHMIILVGSHPSHRALRNVLRQNLKEPKLTGHKGIEVIFLFGDLTNGSNNCQQRQLQKEADEHGDIVQGNFIDSYHNVTLRDLMGLRWAWTNCPRAKYILHMDDDIIFDIDAVVFYLNQCCSNIPAMIACYQVWIQAPVPRSGRYSVAQSEYSKDVFEDYCAGWMYVVTPLMAHFLDGATDRVNYYWMNDAYITGSLIHELSFTHKTLPLSHSNNVQDMKAMLKSYKHTFYSLGPTENDAELTRALIHMYKNRAQQTFVNH